ncbi:16499_t:CDS:10 [Dentiscutata erythropus]|uniref:16499_t:CDS:1 n=1 Tax=Dentiscutata erythropus TaxID=1348616 RepID=A0A9N9HW18_9GLOM|nr:16499_t:CDS:10 [Dentiscutata erythropus]
MADQNEIIPEEGGVNKQAFTSCAKCGQMIVGQFVRALAGTYHLDCFKCQDCGTVVAAKFFPIDGADGKQHPLCERDYFRRLNLICEKCGGALRGSYITALEKKFHIEHFTCSACPTVFGPQDSYYEHDGQVYCHYHYSTRFAVKCTGCKTAILKQFVEINRNNIDEHWHPECYMIHKFWNVKLAAQIDDEPGSYDVPSSAEGITPEKLKQQQKAIEEKVYNIWTVLSAFEEMSAACISDMLLHVSNGAYFEGVKMIERFINHVDILFSAIDDLEVQLMQASGQGLQHNREAKMLCKKIVNFFSLLAHTQEAGVRKLGITQELLALVTGLAHYLKILIRIALTGALKLERDFNNPLAIGQFLNKLVELTKKEGKQVLDYSNVDSEITSDLCHVCRITVEEECYKYGHYRWHIGCLRCSGCSRELRTIYRDATFNQITEMSFCPAHTSEPVAPGYQYVTQLEQYTYLLRIELSRMYNLLKRKDEHSLSDYDEVRSGRKANKEEAGLVRKDSRSKSYSSGDKDKAFVSINTSDIKRMKSVMDRKLSNSAKFAKTSRVIEQEQPNTPQTQDETSKDKLARAPSQHHVRIIDDKMPDSQNSDARMKFDLENEAITLADISAIAAAEMSTEEKSAKKLHRVSRTKLYLSELSGLEYFIVRHVAVLILEQYLKDFFSLDELLDIIGSKKTTLWSKFVQQIRPKEVPVKKKGTFGVPLEVLVERYGVDSVLGAGPGRIRIPSFVDDSISAMKTMDMSVEGIFRKNGNIRRLKDLSEAIDKNPSSVNLAEDNPVQVAALMKKFLRDLPDPLLTFKLHKLFIVTQTSFSHVDEETGSKMDLHNLATVITPNILYSKSKDPIKDESFLAIEAVHNLLRYQDDFWVVPEDLATVLRDQDLINNLERLTPKDIMKRCENLVKLNHSQSTNTNNDDDSSEDFVKISSENFSNYPYPTQVDQGGESRDDSNLHASSSSLANEVSIPVEQRAS